MKKALLLLFVALLGVWAGGFWFFVRQIYAYPRDESTKTEAIIVLTGGRNRITEAGKLYNRKLADKLFISGVNKRVSLNQIERRNEISLQAKSRCSLAKGQRYHRQCGRKHGMVNQNKIKSVRLVTSNYHIPRSLLEFRSRLPELEIIAYPVYSENVQQQWWRSWGSFTLLATEYNKYLYVLLTKKLALNED